MSAPLVYGAWAAFGALAAGSVGLVLALALLARNASARTRIRTLEAEHAGLVAELGEIEAGRRELAEHLAWRTVASAALDAIPDWVLRVDAHGRVVEANRPTGAAFPIPDDPVGQPVVDVYPSHAAATLAEHLDRVRRTGKPLRLELMYGDARGYAETRLFPLPAGELLVVSRDLTDQKSREELLHRSKERYALAVQGANDGLWDWNIETGAVYWSYAWKQMMGLGEAEATGRPEDWFERVHPDDLGPVRDALRAHLDGEAPRFESEHRVRQPDGTWSWVLARGMAVRDSRGTARRIAGSLTDLTNRRVVAVTQEKANLLEHATSSVGIGIAVLQQDRALSRASAVLHEMTKPWTGLDAWWRDVLLATKWPPAEPCDACGAPQHRGTVLAELVSPNTELVRRSGEGAIHVFEIAFAGHAHEIGEAGAHVLLVKDVTESVLARRRTHRLNEELVLARDQALAASRAKSAFLANMSHELRTPLNHILGYAEMIAEELEDHGLTDLAADLGKVRTSGVHLLNLISGILDLSKIEAGLGGLQLETFELGPLLREALGAFEPAAAARGNRLVLEAPAPGALTADRHQVERILTNLLSNAIKFTKDGTITVAVHEEQRLGGAFVVLRVTDTGIGMNSEQLARVAEHFYMADSSSTREFGGTGLGLTLVWRFTDMMGGTVAVESLPGRGSTFLVTLPRRVVAPASPAA